MPSSVPGTGAATVSFGYPGLRAGAFTGPAFATLSLPARDTAHAVAHSPLVASGAVLRKVFPPLFSRYEADQALSPLIDNAIRPLRGSDFRIRADLSATLFLSDARPTTAARSRSRTCSMPSR